MTVEVQLSGTKSKSNLSQNLSLFYSVLQRSIKIHSFIQVSTHSDQNRYKMGSSIQSMGEQMAENMQNGMKKSMQENQRSMMEAQMGMAMRRRELQMAVNIARTRDLLMWVGGATCTIGVLGTIAFVKKGNPAGLIPLLPLSFVCAYQYDMAYGTKLNRIQKEAGKILDTEWRKDDNNRFLLPPNNVLMTREKYEQFTKRDEE